MSVLCYCKRPIHDGERHLILTLTVDWGNDDLRDPAAPKTYEFHSFGCVETWAQDRSLQHDGVVVREGAPA